MRKSKDSRLWKKSHNKKKNAWTKQKEWNKNTDGQKQQLQPDSWKNNWKTLRLENLNMWPCWGPRAQGHKNPKSIWLCKFPQAAINLIMWYRKIAWLALFPIVFFPTWFSFRFLYCSGGFSSRLFFVCSTRGFPQLLLLFQAEFVSNCCWFHSCSFFVVSCFLL